MKINLALLLTRNPAFEQVVAEALKETGAEIVVTHDVDHALQTGCQRVTELDVVIIDRSDCHAITLMGALKTCRYDLPVVVIIASGDSYHCAALAYANGAAACLARPISAQDLKVVLRQLCEPKLKLAEV
jgi:DNA-binding NtrC family response regulator